jgi:hypothetical protein
MCGALSLLPHLWMSGADEKASGTGKRVVAGPCGAFLDARGQPTSRLITLAV